MDFTSPDMAGSMAVRFYQEAQPVQVRRKRAGGGAGCFGVRCLGAALGSRAQGKAAPRRRTPKRLRRAQERTVFGAHPCPENYQFPQHIWGYVRSPGFGEKNLRRMVQFAEVFQEREIVVSLMRQLSWTHFIALIPLKNDLKRDFYAEMCRMERWNFT
jgi:hypothetical protein